MRKRIFISLVILGFSAVFLPAVEGTPFPSDHIGKNIYFLLMVKCEVIAKDIGFKEKSVICLNTSQRLTNQ